MTLEPMSKAPRNTRLLILGLGTAVLVGVAIFAVAQREQATALTPLRPTYAPFVMELAITSRGESTRATFVYEDWDRWRYEVFRVNGSLAQRQEADRENLFVTIEPFGFTEVMKTEGAQPVPDLWFRVRDSFAPTFERSADLLTFTQTREVPCDSPRGTCTEVTRHQFDEATELPILYQIEIDGVVGYEVRVVHFSFEDVDLPDIEPPAPGPASTPEKLATAVPDKEKTAIAR